jgi:pimeloyl-ACP methyl ester carboxylesterase
VGPELVGPPVIILHGYTDNKSSFLPQARFLHEHAVPSLLLDHRGHGESESARVSLGPLEARDVVAVLQTLRDEGKGEQFLLWGVSMGAATALQAAARSRAISSVISESCYERLDQVVTDTLRLRLHLPRYPIVPLALFLASLSLRVRLREVSMPEVMEAIGSRPVLVVSGGRDPRMPPELGERLLARAANGMKHLVVPEADHAECWALGQPAYGDRVLELIEIVYKERGKGG